MPVNPDMTERYREREPAATLEKLFEVYADRVYRLASGMLGDPYEAEDVVQDTFLSVMKKIDQFEYRSSLATWVYRIAYNACIDRLRKKIDFDLPEENNSTEDEGGVLLPKQFIEWRWTPEQMLADAEIRTQLETAIGELSGALRAVFIFRDIEELSIEETAQVLDISSAAVKVRLHRARLALRERLATYFSSVSGGQS